ncbi:MAG: hypothetical protein ABI402_20070 [Ferruginibacter sp.]
MKTFIAISIKMKKNFYIGCFLLLTLVNPVVAQPAYVWANAISNAQPNGSLFYSSSDKAGNSYFVTFFNGSIDADPGPAVW